MNEAKRTLSKRVTDLEERIEKVQTLVGEADSRLEIGDDLRAAMIAKLQKDAEDALVNSPLYKGVRRLLLFAILLGLAVWIGGTIYSGINIKSIYDRSEEAQQKLEIEVGKASNAATGAINSIGGEKDKAKMLLNVDNLTDLKQIQEQIAELKKADGELKIGAIRALIQYSTLILVGLNLLLIVLSLVLWRKLFQERKSRPASNPPTRV